MIKAEIKDKNTIVTILYESFKNDSYINWLVEKSSNKNRLKLLIEYVVEETFARGDIYLNEDHTAVALWNTQKKENISFKYIKKHFVFLGKIGIRTVFRLLKMNNLVYANYPKEAPYKHLYFIGVLPDQQGKGHANTLMKPIIEQMNKASIPIYLETASKKNVEIYKKRGFDIYQIIEAESDTLYLMRTDPSTTI